MHNDIYNPRVKLQLLIEKFGYESQVIVRSHCYGEAKLWARFLGELFSYSLSSFSPGGECFYPTQKRYLYKLASTCILPRLADRGEVSVPRICEGVGLSFESLSGEGISILDLFEHKPGIWLRCSVLQAVQSRHNTLGLSNQKVLWPPGEQPGEGQLPESCQLFLEERSFLLGILPPIFP